MTREDKVLIIKNILIETENKTNILYKKRIDIEERASLLFDNNFNEVVKKCNDKLLEDEYPNLSIAITSTISHAMDKQNRCS